MYNSAPLPPATALRIQTYEGPDGSSWSKNIGYKVLFKHYSKQVLAHKPEEIDDNDMNRLFNAWVKINSWTQEPLCERSFRRAAVLALSKAFEISEVNKKEKQLRQEDEGLEDGDRERLIISGLLGEDKENEWYQLTNTKESASKIQDTRAEEAEMKEAKRHRAEGIMRQIITKTDLGRATKATVTTSSEVVPSRPETSKDPILAKQDNWEPSQQAAVEQKRNSKQSPRKESVPVANVTLTLPERIRSEPSAAPP